MNTSGETVGKIVKDFEMGKKKYCRPPNGMLSAV